MNMGNLMRTSASLTLIALLLPVSAGLAQDAVPTADPGPAVVEPDAGETASPAVGQTLAQADAGGSGAAVYFAVAASAESSSNDEAEAFLAELGAERGKLRFVVGVLAGAEVIAQAEEEQGGPKGDD